MSSNQDMLRVRILRKSQGKRKKFIWQHFKAEGEKKATIYRLTRRIDADETLFRKKATVKTYFRYSEEESSSG